MNHLDQIKQVRDQLNIGLAEAKMLIEEFETPEKAVEAWHQREKEKLLEEETREFVDPKKWSNRGFWEQYPVDENDLEILNNPKVVIFEEHGYIRIGERILKV